jgi:ferric-dicitrate binding protein FerR (iron transport regulator)
MTIRMTLAALCVALLIFGPVAKEATPATPALGQVMVKGDAKVNGIATLTGATVFSGDQVGTETNSIVELRLNDGSKVVLPESSTVVMNDEAAQVVVNLEQGALAVLSKSASPAFIDANGARIKPAASVAVVLEVAIHANSLKVVARRGSATVETADKSLKVEEGKELDATMAPAPPQGQGRGRSASPAFRSSLGTWEMIVAVAAGVTGLTLGAVALARTKNPASCMVVSPSNITCP